MRARGHRRIAMQLSLGVVALGLALGALGCEERSQAPSSQVPPASIERASPSADHPSAATQYPVPATDCDSIVRSRVSSSAIRSIGYCESDHILEVEFIQRAVYRYYAVPEHVYRAFMSASSHGRFMSYVIKPAGYRYQRVR